MRAKFIFPVMVLALLLIGLNCSKDEEINGKNLPQIGGYVVFAWNDLGMHCLNPSYDTAVILPPYNTIWAQVIKQGNPPQIVTSGLTAVYKITNNTYSYGKRSYGQFWDFVQQLFGISLEKDKGLNLSDPDIHNGLSGTMQVKGDHFQADGIPVTPVDDDNVWDPYQIAEITIKDENGNVVAQTKTTVPTSDEINCAKCHGENAFLDILQKHDSMHQTNLVSQKPVLCASCHPSPALGVMSGTASYLSKAVHGAHADRNAACYDCHPGQKTSCNRSIAHTDADGNCTNCHGDLANVANSIATGGRVPWVNEPKCSTCHTNVPEVDTGNELYRNAKGHGNVYCAACHSSPHAMVPSNQESDNYQAIQYQTVAKTIGSCGVCHSGSKGEQNEIDEFSEKHGGTNPEKRTACNICHTATPSKTSDWPHKYQWKNRG